MGPRGKITLFLEESLVFKGTPVPIFAALWGREENQESSEEQYPEKQHVSTVFFGISIFRNENNF